MIRTQISVDERLYLQAKVVAKRRGVSLAELCRRGLEEMIAKELSDKPWLAFAGMFEGQASDSTSVDQVVITTHGGALKGRIRVKGNIESTGQKWSASG